MSDTKSFTSKMRAAAKAVAPQWLVDAMHASVMRRYDLAIVVKRESRLKHWFSKHVLRLYYPPSLVSRQNAIERWTATHVRHELPTLYHFDIHITDHCNLNCRGCGHFSNLCPPTFLDLDAFRADMAAMAAKLRIEQIYLLGGEPLLHPQVSEFIRAARAVLPRDAHLRRHQRRARHAPGRGVLARAGRHPHDSDVRRLPDRPAGRRHQPQGGGDGRHHRVDRGARAVLQGAARRHRIAGRGRLVPALQRHQQLPDVQGRPPLPVRVHVLHRGVQGAVRHRERPRGVARRLDLGRRERLGRRSWSS